jgi:hypothetical protein
MNLARHYDSLHEENQDEGQSKEAKGLNHKIIGEPNEDSPVCSLEF